MDERTARYIGELEHELKKLPARDREDALREIRSHLQEASDSGTPSPLTLARLGSPRNLAAAYMGDYLSARESSLPPRGAWPNRFAPAFDARRRRPEVWVNRIGGAG